ncbi:MAG: acyl-CoA dehydratase activase [Candidatus Helarchaeota archaeon]
MSDKLIVAGCDVGSLTGKMVILEVDDSDNTKIEIIASSIVPTRIRPALTAQDALNAALKNCKSDKVKSIDDINYIIGTGYGRVKIPFANKNISEISCHGKGAFWADHDVRTIVDIGGQDCKVIRIDDEGKLEDFTMNDKCAAGTGRFLEVMSKALELELDELGPVALKSKNPAKITAQCSVFAESEVISLIGSGANVEDIAAGIVNAIASRINSLINRVGLKREVTMTGGVAKNIGVIVALENKLNLKIRKLSIDPQLMGAIGAALFAIDQYKKEKDTIKAATGKKEVGPEPIKMTKKRKLKKWDF